MNLFDWIFVAAKKTKLIFYISFGMCIIMIAACLFAVSLNAELKIFAFIYSIGKVVHFIINFLVSGFVVKDWRFIPVHNHSN